MAVQIESGQILLDGGAVALDADCCCDTPPPCLCAVVKSLGACECLAADYGPTNNIGDCVVSISGTCTPYKVNSSPPTGSECGPGSDCPAIAGDFVVACGGSEYWCLTEYACTIGSVDYYYIIGVQVIWSYPNIFVNINANMATSDLYPTLSAGCSPFAVWKTRQLRYQFSGTKDDWQYVPSAACRPECNFVIARTACPNGTLVSVWDSDTSNTPIVPPMNYCEIDGLTVTAEILTP